MRMCNLIEYNDNYKKKQHLEAYGSIVRIYKLKTTIIILPNLGAKATDSFN